MENSEKQIKRGDIYVYDFGNNPGSVQSGIRPVLVLQGNEFNEHSPTTIIAPISSAIKKTYLPSHIFLGEEYGLKMPSMILVEQLCTVNQNELGKYIGTVDDEPTLKKIWKAFKKTLGMWDYSLNKKKDVYCLCHRCLDDFRSRPNVIVSRLDPFADEKDVCTICNVRYGYDYVVSERSKSF